MLSVPSESTNQVARVKRTVGRSPAVRPFYGYIFIAPFFVVFAIFQLYPIFYSLYLSFTDWDGFSAPAFVGLENYRRLIDDPFFYRSIRNTFLIWGISIVPQLPLALILAFILNEHFVRGKHLFRAIYFFPNIVTPVTIGVLFSLLFDWQTGAANRLLLALNLVDEPVNWLGEPTLARILVAAVMTWQWFGYNMLLYIAGLQSIPEELSEAARIDGANSFQVATGILIPLLRPVIMFTVITSVIGGMQIFDVPFTLTGTGPNNSTLTMVMFLYQAAFERSQYGYGAAVAYAIFLLIAALSLGVFWLARNRGK